MAVVVGGHLRDLLNVVETERSMLRLSRKESKEECPYTYALGLTIRSFLLLAMTADVLLRT